MRTDKMSQNKEETANGDTISQKYISLQKNEHIRKNIQDISKLLNTGLSAEALDTCIELCEAGVHPQVKIILT